MRVKYPGCKYNSVVFEDVDTEFANWLDRVWWFLQTTIESNPSTYCTLSNHPTFNVHPVFNNEFRVKLATNSMGGAVQALTSLVTRNNELVDPSNVWSGSHMTPIIRVYYHTDRKDDFGLSFVLLKAIYDCGPPPISQVSTDLWEIDDEYDSDNARKPSPQ
jgi:hypothetical protein